MIPDYIVYTALGAIGGIVLRNCIDIACLKVQVAYHDESLKEVI